MSHFWEICGQCRKFARVIKISQILVFHFTTPFSGQQIQVGMDEMYEMYQSYQKFYTKLAKELIVFFFLC